MLILQGLRWLRKGKHVLVLNPRGRPMAIFEMIAFQLSYATMTDKSCNGLEAVSNYQCKLADGTKHDVKRIVDELTQFAKAHGNQLHILVDESFFDAK
jgi:hypothetical protein